MAGSFSKRVVVLLFIIALKGCAGSALLTEDHGAHPSLFKYEGPARSVCITGDFNQWSPDTHCLRRHDGLWTIHLMLPAGIHRYAFVINGRQWIADPKALFFETDGFGRQNSMAVVN